MNKKFEIEKYAYDKNPSSHIHEEFEILISLNNEGRFFVREHGYPLQFGMCFILPPFEIHRCFCNGNQNYERYIIHFSKALLETFSTDSTDITGLLASGPFIFQMHDNLLSKSLGALTDLTKKHENAFGTDVEQSLRFGSFLLSLSQFVHAHRKEFTSLPDVDERVSMILAYIHEHYMESISLDAIARHMFISKSNLSHLFKDATGFSVGDYIIMYRVKHACALLQNGMHVQDVAIATGFTNSTHFIRTFKARVGCSPRKFACSTGC